MVGWSRRNAEARARRRKWWSSLSDEEKRLAAEREAIADKRATRVMLLIVGIFFMALVGTFFTAHGLLSFCGR